MGKTMTCEKDVKDVVKKLFKQYGVWYFMPVQTGYARAGIPDFIACYQGTFLAIETKFGGNRPTQNQWKELHAIADACGRSAVIDESNLHHVEWLLRDIEAALS